MNMEHKNIQYLEIRLKEKANDKKEKAIATR